MKTFKQFCEAEISDDLKIANDALFAWYSVMNDMTSLMVLKHIDIIKKNYLQNVNNYVNCFIPTPQQKVELEKTGKIKLIRPSRGDLKFIDSWYPETYLNQTVKNFASEHGGKEIIVCYANFSKLDLFLSAEKFYKLNESNLDRRTKQIVQGEVSEKEYYCKFKPIEFKSTGKIIDNKWESLIAV